MIHSWAKGRHFPSRQSGSDRYMAGRDVWTLRCKLNGSLHVGHACHVKLVVFHSIFLSYSQNHL